MSLYREVGRSRRAIAVAAIVALVLGVAGGYALGRATAPDPDLAEQVAEVGDSVRPALNALELVGIEYPQAAGGDETELGAAESQAAGAVTTLEGQRAALEALDPAAYGDALEKTRTVEELISSGQAPARVLDAAEQAAAAIRKAARVE